MTTSIFSVQPLKALGAIAIAQGLGADEIAAAALILGATFLVLGSIGVIDHAGRAFPRALIRGVQLTVGLLFLKVACGLVADPPASFEEHALAPEWAIPLGASIVVAAVLLRGRPVALALVGVGVVVMLIDAGGMPSFGPSAIELPSLSQATFAAALTALVIPQLPLTFANSCLAPADAARTYFGKRARHLRRAARRPGQYRSWNRCEQLTYGWTVYRCESRATHQTHQPIRQPDQNEIDGISHYLVCRR